MPTTPPVAAQLLISLGRTSKKWRRFAVQGSGFSSYTPHVEITNPPGIFECKNPPTVKSDSLLLVFARPIGSKHYGDTDNITVTVTNAGTPTAVGGAPEAYADDDDPAAFSAPPKSRKSGVKPPKKPAITS